MPPKKQKERGGAPSQISDARFTKFESDPRYRLPSRRETKTKLDSRFGKVLKDKEFTATTQIDRYGRKIKTDKKKKALERLYEMDDEEDSEEGSEEEDDDDSEDDKPKSKSKTTPYDAARGGGFSASESEEDSEDDEDEEEDLGVEGEDDEDDDAVDTQQFREEEAEVPTGEVTNRIAIVNLDWDHVKSRDLMAMFSSFVPKDGRGRIEKISVYPSQFGKERMQREELEGPPREIFRDAKKADDDSDVDSDYSEESEQSEEESEDDEQVKKDLLREENDQDFDSNALRSYQLDRLRYYYAVMVCSDAATAEAIYRATDGSEYQSSSNFVDLRFVPDDVTFDDDEPRDECTEVPSNYKPVEFVTNALQHSKVKLTWDMHPEDNSRKDLMKKAFSGTPAELIENDLRAYLASDSDGDDDDFEDDGEEFGGVEDAKEEEEVEGEGTEDKKEEKKPVKLSKKEQARQKMRAALGLSEEPAKSSGSSKHAPVGGMQITFTPALSDAAAATKKKAADGTEETTLEKYKRKEKERKEKRKQKAIAKREGRGVDAEEDGGEDEDDRLAKEIMAGGDNAADVDLGFDDPFFTSEDPAAAVGAPSKSSVRKEERLKKRAAREAEEREKEKSRAQLEALMGGDGEAAGGAAGHFDLREVIKAEKQRQKEERKKNRRNHNRQGHDDVDEGDGGAAGASLAHGVDVSDPRLQAVLSGADFAIDPSNPQYKDTLGLQQMQNEARRKRKTSGGDAADKDADKTAKKPKTAAASRNDELANLVKSVKSKAKKAAM
ncbi:pre-rRNA-processing protein esf1 [Sporothrix bragantina]|uniref:Pre-rRNA-processing protein esf1 n=1 Tax=Sporothrix bragantina TaxID=671064 RepID=A0ABP0AVI8_9PEZI